MSREERSIYIDKEDGLGRVRGNQGLYKRMLGLYLKSTELVALEEALQAEDAPRIEELAHGLKGMTGNLGLTRMFELTSELMARARKGEIKQPLLADYRAAAEATREHVEALMAELV